MIYCIIVSIRRRYTANIMQMNSPKVLTIAITMFCDWEMLSMR